MTTFDCFFGALTRHSSQFLHYDRQFRPPNENQLKIWRQLKTNQRRTNKPQIADRWAVCTFKTKFHFLNVCFASGWFLSENWLPACSTAKRQTKIMPAVLLQRTKGASLSTITGKRWEELPVPQAEQLERAGPASSLRRPGLSSQLISVTLRSWQFTDFAQFSKSDFFGQ